MGKILMGLMWFLFASFIMFLPAKEGNEEIVKAIVFSNWQYAGRIEKFMLK